MTYYENKYTSSITTLIYRQVNKNNNKELRTGKNEINK